MSGHEQNRVIAEGWDMTRIGLEIGLIERGFKYYTKLTQRAPHLAALAGMPEIDTINTPPEDRQDTQAA